MKNTIRTFVVAGAMLLAVAGTAFATISGGDPRPSSNPPSLTATMPQLQAALAQ